MPRKIQKVNFTKNHYEFQAWQQGETVLGIDEVGRGCLAGPLVTAAVIMPPHTKNRLIKDSKLLTESERAKANAWITQHCWYGIGMVNHRTIDQINIWHATLIGMQRAVLNLLATCPVKPTAILVDAMPLKLYDTPYENIPVHNFPKGEQWSSSIAAASIVAKVMRDELMTKIDSVMPGYSLSQHKGYATLQHKYLISTLNSSILHRQSFLNNIDHVTTNTVVEKQQSFL